MKNIKKLIILLLLVITFTDVIIKKKNLKRKIRKTISLLWNMGNIKIFN